MCLRVRVPVNQPLTPRRSNWDTDVCSGFVWRVEELATVRSYATGLTLKLLLLWKISYNGFRGLLDMILGSFQKEFTSYRILFVSETTHLGGLHPFHWDIDGRHEYVPWYAAPIYFEFDPWGTLNEGGQMPPFHIRRFNPLQSSRLNP